MTTQDDAASPRARPAPAAKPPAPVRVAAAFWGWTPGAEELILLPVVLILASWQLLTLHSSAGQVAIFLGCALGGCALLMLLARGMLRRNPAAYFGQVGVSAAVILLGLLRTPRDIQALLVLLYLALPGILVLPAAEWFLSGGGQGTTVTLKGRRDS